LLPEKRLGVQILSRQMGKYEIPNSWKKAKGIVLKPFFQTPLFFLDTDCSIFKTHYKDHILMGLKDI
jgi:hypothetical protein